MPCCACVTKQIVFFCMMQAPSRMGDTRLSAVESKYKVRKGIKVNPEPAQWMLFENSSRKIKNGVNTRLHLLERWTGSIRLNYRFKFSSNFEWGSGGILPGVLGGRWWCTPNRKSSQCWRIQLGWNEQGEADIVSRIPQAKTSISSSNTLKFQKSAWNRVSIVVRVNTGRSSNGEVEISVNDKVLAVQSGILFSTDKTRSVYLMLSGKYADSKTIPKSSSLGEMMYILAKDYEVQQVKKIPPPPPPSPPPPPPPSPPPPTILPSPSPVSSDPIPQPIPDNAPSVPTPTGPYQWQDMTPDQYRRALMLTSIFENAKLELQYGFCKNINDGRGFTFGFCGFVTKHADGRQVLQEYLKMRPDDAIMANYLEIMKQPSPGNDGTSQLVGFCEAVEALGNDEAFRKAQDTIQQRRYYEPSKVWGQRIGARYGLTKGQIYDAMINHGQGKQDSFSIDHIVEKTAQAMGGYPLDGVDEMQWLAKFLEIRDATIKGAGDIYTRRIQFYKALLDVGNYNLDGMCQ